MKWSSASYCLASNGVVVSAYHQAAPSRAEGCSCRRHCHGLRRQGCCHSCCCCCWLQPAGSQAAAPAARAIACSPAAGTCRGHAPGPGAAARADAVRSSRAAPAGVMAVAAGGSPPAEPISLVAEDRHNEGLQAWAREQLLPLLLDGRQAVRLLRHPMQAPGAGWDPSPHARCEGKAHTGAWHVHKTQQRSGWCCWCCSRLCALRGRAAKRQQCCLT
jgi:hypothetical protein